MPTPISRLMQQAVVSATAEETVGEVRARMGEMDVGALPVVDRKGVLVGIVTSDDLLTDYEPTLPVSRVMSAPVHTVTPDTTAPEAARRMRELRHHHLVVVENDKVVGMLSSFDLLRAVH